MAKSSHRRRLRLRGEILEDRLALAWLGVPPASIAPPASAASVAFNSQQNAQGTAAITAAEIDYYTFLAPATGSYRIAAQTPSSSLDPVLGVFNSAGQRLAYNDDFGGSTDSQLTLNLTSGARYYVGVTNYTSSAAGAYTWIVDGPTPTSSLTDDAYEQNDSFTTARNLGSLNASTSIPGLIMADGTDWYRFQTSAMGGSSHHVTINFQHAQGDVDLELYNASGVRLASSTSTTNQEHVSLSGRAAGTYYVRVYGYQGATNPSYSLSIAPPGMAPSSTVDLAGASLSVVDAAQWGQTLSTQASVRNNGTAASGAFQVEWYLSRDAVGSSDDVLLSRTGGAGSFYSHASIAPGAVGGSFTVSLQLPSAAPAGWTGSSLYLVMRTDSAGQVAESNGSNNFGQAGNGVDREVISINAASPSTAGGFRIDIVSTGMTASQAALFQQAADRWEQVITGDLPNATYNGQTVDDLLIHASGAAIDGTGGILGQAGPDRFRSGTSLPYHGSMEFDTADLAAMQANGTLLGVILHEIGHVLGIGTIWDYRGLLSGGGGSNPRFTGAQATAAYNQIFGRNETSVPVENSGGPGTRDGHWRETVFTTELMTGYIGPGTVLPLSRVTVASLADLGYQVNLAAADAFTPSPSAAVAAASTSSTPALFDAALRSPLLAPVLTVPGALPTSEDEVVAPPGPVAASSSVLSPAAYPQAVDAVLAEEADFRDFDGSLPDPPRADIGVRLSA